MHILAKNVLFRSGDYGCALINGSGLVSWNTNFIETWHIILIVSCFL